MRFWPFSAVLALAALAVVPLLENRRLEAAVATLMSGDIDGIVRAARDDDAGLRDGGKRAGQGEM